MRLRLVLAVIVSSSLAVAAGCAGEPGPDALGDALGGVFGAARQSLFGACGLGDEVLAAETLTPASIPALTVLERAQIVAAVQESAHTDVTTVEVAFDRVDGHEINRIVLWDAGTNQFYVEIEYGAGDNSYGAIFYWGTAHKAAAIHDGFEEECGPLTFNYDEGDTAPECAGVLTYLNIAPIGALDGYLPSDVAQAVVAARAVAPFDSLASVVAVDGVADFRLQQFLYAARTAGLVGSSCSGIYDRIAISTAEAAAMVAFVNEASASELHGVLSFLINQGVVDTLIANRPVAAAGDISATAGVGPAVFRALRNAATFRRPWEELAAAVNQIDHPDSQIRLDTHFDWVPLVTGAANFTSMSCFGIAASLLPAGATVRAALGDGAEVMQNVGDAVASADYPSELSLDPTPGLTDLEWRTSGRSFLGCYIAYHPNPWVYDHQTFFVDTARGTGVLITSHYVE
jgi:hypothetical protein